jgi:hypothetical protein
MHRNFQREIRFEFEEIERSSVKINSQFEGLMSAFSMGAGSNGNLGGAKG